MSDEPPTPSSELPTDVIDTLDDAGRLCRWTTEEDLVRCADEFS